MSKLPKKFDTLMSHLNGEENSTAEGFRGDMGERPDGMTLDRIDCNGDYSASNCRWADNITQRANQRPHKRSVRSV